MRGIIIILFFALSVYCDGQELWNDTLLISFPNMLIKDFNSANDTLVLYGVGFNNNTEWKQGVGVIQLDSNGMVLNQRFILDSLGDKLAIDDGWGKVICTKDGGYALTAATFYRESAFLIKLDRELSVQFIKEYPDTINLSNFDYKVKEVSGGYFLFGSIQWPDTISRGFVKYVDTNGNIIWNRYFQNTSFDNRVLDVGSLSDSTFVV